MRVRSLKKDKNDWNRFRHHRDRYTGFTFHNEWCQPKPFFWTAEGNTIPLAGNFRGAHAFLIAGGPSFNAIDKEPLKYCFTMAMNNSVKSCLPHFRPDAWCTVDDPSRMLASIWLDPKIMKFVPHAHTEKKLWNSTADRWEPLTDHKGREIPVRDMPNMIYYHRNEKFMANRYLWEDTINWGCHSNHVDEYGHKGARSVMLAAVRILFILGFRTIYLLGVDFEMSRRQKYSFDEQRTKQAIRNNNNSYAALIERFKGLVPEFKDAGLNVYNCNPNSKLTVFSQISYSDAISAALENVGGVDGLLTERTHNMYMKQEEKLTQYKKRRLNNGR